LRDIYGNISTTTLTSPASPASFEIHDLSNTAEDLYRLFIAWTPYTSAPGATFSQYQIWRSTDNTNYSLFQTITDAATNYYLDPTVASSTTYYYKLRTIDTDGDSSAYTPVVHTTPQGLGGSSLPPNISGISISNVKNTSAEVVWSTDGLANSLVYYGTTGSYGSTKSSTTFVTNHQVYLTGLQPNTTYHVKVASTDFYGNTATNDNAGASYSFTTNGGPEISNVTVNAISDKSATIFWNTDRSADSQVFYSTNADLSNPSQVGDTTLVATTSSSGTYSHAVTLTGLAAATTYYFYVSSDDSSGNITTDTDNGSYYSFLTTRDTTPPVISNISTPVLSSTAAVVVWQTDKLSSSQVEWGTTASTSENTYTNVTTLDTTPTLVHVASINGLTEKTTYYYRVRSVDPAGNSAYSDENDFTTPDSGTTKIVSVSNRRPSQCV
jgi:hypothetical protein